MKKLWLNKKNNPRLVVFFNGWGMDRHPCSHLRPEDLDVLMFYDYTKIEDFPPAQLDYSQVFLVAWSLGVWSAARSISNPDIFDRKIAINGTLNPISRDYGIAPEIFARTAEHWSDGSKIKFNRRMCRKSYGFFKEHESRRSCEGQKAELLALKEDILQHDLSASDFYDSAVISNDDWIFPAAAQQNFWRKKNVGIKQLEAAHYFFEQFTSWKEITDLG